SMEPLTLDQVPPLVYLEVMRDVDLFVGVASVGVLAGVLINPGHGSWRTVAPAAVLATFDRHRGEHLRRRNGWLLLPLRSFESAPRHAGAQAGSPRPRGWGRPTGPAASSQDGPLAPEQTPWFLQRRVAWLRIPVGENSPQRERPPDVRLSWMVRTARRF